MKILKVVILEVGAGSTVPTIRNFNDSYSKRHTNFNLIRINPIEHRVLNKGDIGIKGGGIEVMQKLFK